MTLPPNPPTFTKRPLTSIKEDAQKIDMQYIGFRDNHPQMAGVWRTLQLTPQETRKFMKEFIHGR